MLYRDEYSRRLRGTGQRSCRRRRAVVSCRPSNRTCAISLQRGTRSLFAIRFYSQGSDISRSERETRAQLPACFRTSWTSPAGYGYMFGVVATGCRRRRVAMPMVRCPWSPEYHAGNPVIMRILSAQEPSRRWSSRTREIEELALLLSSSRVSKLAAKAPTLQRGKFRDNSYIISVLFKI